MTLQWIIVGIIVCTALFFALRYLLRPRSGCNSEMDCPSCDLHDICNKKKRNKLAHKK